MPRKRQKNNIKQNSEGTVAKPVFRNSPYHFLLLGGFGGTFSRGEGMRLRRDKKGAFCNAPFFVIL
jgi:hypothetical protein